MGNAGADALISLWPGVRRRLSEYAPYSELPGRAGRHINNTDLQIKMQTVHMDCREPKENLISNEVCHCLLQSQSMPMVFCYLLTGSLAHWLTGELTD